MKILSNTLFLLLLIPSILVAHDLNEGKYTKQKTISKAYIVNPDAGIDIQNSYGNIFVTTWDEDKIELNIIIKVSGDHEESVTKRLDKIDIDLTALKHMVTAVTTIEKSNTSGNNNSMEINYTIKIPKKGSVKLVNKYGNIMTSDLLSGVNVTCKYGKVTMGKLTGGASNIKIDYCDRSVIEAIKSGNIEAKYSKLVMNNFGTLHLDAKYTDVTTMEGENLKYDCSYGKLNFGNVKNIDGIGNYLEIKANELSGNLRIQTQYSKISIANVTSNAKNIDITSGYTNVNVNYNTNYAFNYDVNVRYANFNYDDDLESQSKQEGNFTKSYQGHYKKSGENKVAITSNYGNVRLNKN